MTVDTADADLLALRTRVDILARRYPLYPEPTETVL